MGGIVAIDGPVAAGKGTVAHILATKLQGFYLYTGAMYRTVALLCLRQGIDLQDKAAVLTVLPQLQMQFEADRILQADEDITEELMQPPAANGSSIVAAMPEVRSALVKLQQEIGRAKSNAGQIVIVEGRDTATVVFPDAQVKIFLTARPEIRAQRRVDQLAAHGESLPLETVLADVKERDHRDQTRKTDPLMSDPAAAGYVVVDDSAISKEETVERIIRLIQEKGL